MTTLDLMVLILGLTSVILLLIASRGVGAPRWSLGWLGLAAFVGAWILTTRIWQR